MKGGGSREPLPFNVQTLFSTSLLSKQKSLPCKRGGLFCFLEYRLKKGFLLCHPVLHHCRVQSIRINNQVMDEKMLDCANDYPAAYNMVILQLNIVVISLDDFSAGTNFSAGLACFNSIGPGLEAVGPTCNYAACSVISNLVLLLDMPAARLKPS